MTPTPDPRLADIIRRHQQAFQRRERQTRYEQKQQRKESLAAAQGRADAQFNLGVMHAKGRGVPQDYGLALKWYRLAAAQGHAKAQSNLGVMYYTGNGVPQDYVEAVKWFRLAAAHGDRLDLATGLLLERRDQNIKQARVLRARRRSQDDRLLPVAAAAHG